MKSRHLYLYLFLVSEIKLRNSERFGYPKKVRSMAFTETFIGLNLIGFSIGCGLSIFFDEILGSGTSSFLAGALLWLYPVFLILIGLGDTEVSTANLESLKMTIAMIGFFVSFVIGVHSIAWINQGSQKSESTSDSRL